MEKSINMGNKRDASNKKKFSALGGIGRSLIINALLPWLIYHVLSDYTTLSELMVVALTGVPSALDSIIGIVRNRRIDVVAGFVLTAMALSLVFIMLGGDPKIYLVRDSLIAAVFGLAILLSLLLRKSIMYYSMRHIITGGVKENVIRFDEQWPQALPLHSVVRDFSFIWGIGLLLETAVRVPLVLMLSISTFLIVSPLVQWGFYGVLMLLSMFVGRRVGQFFKEREQKL